MKEVKGVKLTEEQLDLINGGLVVRTSDGKYHVVQDHDGLHLTATAEKGIAEWASGIHGQSRMVISEEEYKKLFGKEI